MNNKFPLLATTFLLIFSSCKKSSLETKESSEITSDSTANTINKPLKTNEFDINSVPFSNAQMGEFPFFTTPENIQIQNKPLQKKFDRLFFPINGVMQPLEGKVWKASFVGNTDDSDSWSYPYFEKSYDEAIKKVGGVKIFDGKVSSDELDRIKDDAIYFGEEGSLDYWNEPTKVYLIRKADGGDIYIQFSGNTATAQIQILQKEPFKQSITMIKSDQIQKDLVEKGKSILHLNFDTDKATLKSDGIAVVNEILKVLKENGNLNISINGYTDNTGFDARNLQLSKDRAKAVQTLIIEAGINKSRLRSNGFGSNNPIGDNSTEIGKAQNRRVELIKL